MAEQMKDSGITWLGKIPENWSLRPIKYISSCNTDVLTESTAPDYSFRYVDIGSVTYEHGITEYQDMKFENSPSRARRKVKKGDTIISTVRTYLKAIAMISDDKDVIVSTGFAVYTPNSNINPRFLNYSCKSEGFVQEIEKYSYGIAYPAINTNLLNRICIAYPQYRNQKLIADFLDRECAQIDSITADLEKQIELLQQYKKSLITETVTKGLDKSVPMKDSGIEWIGQIPEHWEICRIKDSCTIARGGSPRPINEFLSDNPNDINWIRIGDTIKGSKYINHTDQKIIKAGIISSRFVHKGDLLLTNSMSFGQPYILGVDGCIHDGWLVFSEYAAIDKLFLYYVLMSDLCLVQFKTSVAGAVVENLSVDKVGASKIFLPPIDEQREIVAHLDEKVRETDNIIDNKQRQLQIMQQHKKSLIYEYVTGKKRVKEAQ